MYEYEGWRREKIREMKSGVRAAKSFNFKQTMQPSRIVANCTASDHNVIVQKTEIS